MDDKKFKVTYEDKTWEGEDQIFTLSLFAHSRKEAREMAEELTSPARIISIEEQG
jgi:hypothetical protein